MLDTFWLENAEYVSNKDEERLGELREGLGTTPVSAASKYNLGQDSGLKKDCSSGVEETNPAPKPLSSSAAKQFCQDRDGDGCLGAAKSTAQLIVQYLSVYLLGSASSFPAFTP